MKAIFLSEYLKTKMDSELPVIQAVLTKLPQQSTAMMEICNSFLEIVDVSVRARGLIYSVCDCKSLSPYSFDLFVNYYITVLPQLSARGMVFTAFVTPHNLQNTIDYPELIKKLNSRPIAFFDDYGQAYQFICEELSKTSLSLSPTRQ